MVASSESNVDQAKEVGLKILKSMKNMVIKDYSFRQSNQAVLMTAKCATMGLARKVDPSLLFQRFVLLMKR